CELPNATASSFLAVASFSIYLATVLTAVASTHGGSTCFEVLLCIIFLIGDYLLIGNFNNES
ncbi:hypothetical protein LINPERPRIM_LOCUS14788, partial [Linum perenne]